MPARPTSMRTLPRRHPHRLAAVPAAALAMLLVAGCGSSSDDTAADPAGGTEESPSDTATAAPGEPPTSAPASDGEVTTGQPVVVIEKKGGSPEMCLGVITAIFPPDCGGPAVTGWDWEEQRDVQRQDGTTFGTYLLTGTWDGEALDVETAVPAKSAGNLGPADPEESAPPAGDLSGSQARELARELQQLPYALSAVPGEGQVLLDVVYDDGSIQAWADAEHGAGAVVVVSQLSEVEG